MDGYLLGSGVERPHTNMVVARFTDRAFDILQVGVLWACGGVEYFAHCPQEAQTLRHLASPLLRPSRPPPPTPPPPRPTPPASQAMRARGAPAAPVVNAYGAIVANISFSDVKAVAR